MHVDNSILIKDLLNRCDQNIAAAEKFKLMSVLNLNHKESPDEWSILECLEHLNLYGDYYLSAIEKSMIAAKDVAESTVFKSGWIGNYFANLMLPKDNGAIKKMKSPQDKNPVQSQLDLKCIDRFLNQQEQLKKLLQQALHKDLSKLKTPISISKWLKLRLGDTFRFVVYHNQRHIAQALRIADKTIN